MSIPLNSAVTVEAMYEETGLGKLSRAKGYPYRHRLGQRKKTGTESPSLEGGGNPPPGLMDELYEICQEPEGDSAKDFAGRMDRLASLNTDQLEEIHELKTLETVLKQSLRRERLTKYLIQLMSRSFDVKIILEIISRQIGLFLGTDRCLVAYYEQDPEASQTLNEIGRVALLSQFCSSERISPVHEDDISRELVVLHREYAVLAYDVVHLPEVSESVRDYMQSYRVQSVLGVQIRYRDRVYGRLVLHQCDRPRDWAAEDIEFLEVLAMHIGSALYQASLYQEEKRLRQEAEEANRQKSKVLSFVAHDLKNPLASILRFSEILRANRQDISEEYWEIAGFIAQGASQMQSMVTDILDKARLENGKMVPTLESIALSPFIDRLRPTLEAMASLRNVRLHIEVDPSLPSIQADLVHLRQILINLLSNAVKYNRPEGSVFLRCYTGESDPVAVIEVRDTGRGIPPEKMPHLFVEYYRTDLTAANPVEGTGLGLAFIKKLVELHGGRLSVASEEGVGSTIRVMLPLPGSI